MQTLLVYAHEHIDKDFPEHTLVHEFSASHFPNLTFFKLDANPGKYFSTWLLEKKSALVVCGSYSRSGFAQFFQRSFVQDVIADHKLPVFIAHR